MQDSVTDKTLSLGGTGDLILQSPLVRCAQSMLSGQKLLLPRPRGSGKAAGMASCCACGQVGL